LEEILNPVQVYRTANGLPPRSFDELALELLALGVTLHEHIAQAELMPTRVIRLLQFMIEFEPSHPRFEHGSKTLRGWINGLFFPKNDTAARPWSTASVQKLAVWLAVQGAEPQAQRFSEWLDYFNQAGAPASACILSASFELVQKFALLSETNLGAYTSQVAVYRDQMKAAARWRYDGLLISSSPLEYHLGMLATEVLNRAYRARFEAAKHKMVILPPCMSARPQDQCQAIPTPLGAQCGGCTPSCRVNQISKTAAEKGIRVVMIPDDQLSQLCHASGQVGKGLGVIGAACALRNWSAGWEADRLGLNGQGILLDSAGCEKHWTRHGMTTDVNMQELVEML
jgi:hypothetical protein